MLVPRAPTPEEVSGPNTEACREESDMKPVLFVGVCIVERRVRLSSGGLLSDLVVGRSIVSCEELSTYMKRKLRIPKKIIGRCDEDMICKGWTL